MRRVTTFADDATKAGVADFVTAWRHEADVWAYAIKKGEELLARQLLVRETREVDDSSLVISREGVCQKNA
jgi:hypothetical protein